MITRQLKALNQDNVVILRFPADVYADLRQAAGLKTVDEALLDHITFTVRENRRRDEMSKG